MFCLPESSLCLVRRSLQSKPVLSTEMAIQLYYSVRGEAVQLVPFYDDSITTVHGPEACT